MQVVRLLERHPRSLPAKLGEMAEALALERRLSKEQVLGLYLTLAPFGGNLEGVRAASLAYFGKEPARSLAGGMRACSSPSRAPPSACARTATPRRRAPPATASCARMAEAGVISPAALAEARAEDVPRLGSPCRSARRTWHGRCATKIRRRRSIARRSTPLLQQRVEELLKREVSGARCRGLIAAIVVENRDRAGAGLCRQRRFRRGSAARHARHGARGALAGLGAEAVHLCDGVRPADHPPGDRARRPARGISAITRPPISTGISRAT